MKTFFRNLLICSSLAIPMSVYANDMNITTATPIPECQCDKKCPMEKWKDDMGDRMDKLKNRMDDMVDKVKDINMKKEMQEIRAEMNDLFDRDDHKKSKTTDHY